MSSEIRLCKNCRKEFTIESEDFSFYERIKVPPPKLCRECRQMRRMGFRNERTLYKRKCDKTNRDIISAFAPDAKYVIYDYKYWYGDDFDAMAFPKEYDFSKPFFEQFDEFLRTVPLPSVRNRATENSEYNNDTSESVNCYLCSRTHKSKDILYGYRVNSSSDCVDCMQVVKSSNFLYECVECVSCKNSSYLYFCENSAYSHFLYNCKNCIDCFMCTNLRNKQNCFMNVQLSKEEYDKKVKGFNLGSYKTKQELIVQFEELRKKAVRKNLHIVSSQNVRGDNILNCKNVYMSFGARNIEDGRYLWDMQNAKDSMDCYSGATESELLYECTATTTSSNVQFSTQCTNLRDCEYMIFSQTCQDCFACIGLKNKQFCIFNKQYTESEYNELLPKIIEHMKSNQEYGEFFPLNISFFAYNETIAQEYFPLTKEEVLNKGLLWRDQDKKDYKATLQLGNIPDDIKEVSEEITKETIPCSHKQECQHGCTNAFKVIPRELDFYKRMGLPIPRLCPNCRHYQRLISNNPKKLWPGKCQCAGNESDNEVYKNLAKHHHHGEDHCPNEFETSYAPDRPEIVYCEKCYQQEVY